MTAQTITAGQYLQREREKNNILLSSVAKETKISLTHLEALEKDELNQRMPEVFIRGYLSNYAKVMHMDPEEVMDLYRQQKNQNYTPEEIEGSFLNSFLQGIASLFNSVPFFSAGKNP